MIAFMKVQSFVGALAVLILSGCQWETKARPSILILAVDSLSSDQVPCTDLETGGGEPSGFDILCSESVRFTHAYTPSVLSQAALASLVTAKWPHQTGVIHNGPNFLQAKETTVAEVALERQFRTLFISGGPPILKKSGLSQGFEFFEDNIAVTRNRFFRPIQDSSELFLNWLKKEVGRDPFFAMIYVPDLQFFDLPQAAPESGPVETSFEGRLDFLDRQMATLFESLRELNRWNDTYIFLVGLNGHPRVDRVNELDGFELLSENSQVGLLIKPAQIKRDLGIQWKVDANVTLVDVAKTVFDLLAHPVKSEAPFDAVSLVKTLNSPEPDWDADRGILIQSAWSEWHGAGRSRFGIRLGHYLYLHEFPPKIYNSLIDRMETSPIKPNDPRWNETVNLFAPYTATLKAAAWMPPPRQLVQRVLFARALWTQVHTVSAETYLDEILGSKTPDEQVTGWFAALAIERAKWEDLLKLGKKFKNQEWIYLASQQLKQKADMPATPCFRTWQNRTAKGFDPQSLKSCEDPIFRDLFSWIVLSSGSDNNYYRETFLKTYIQFLVDRRVGQMNYINGLLWDVSPNLPGGPTEGEVLLNLPENQKFLAMTNEKLERPDP
jgi:hypothetical protein